MSEKSLTHFQTAMADIRHLWSGLPAIPSPSPVFDHADELKFSAMYRTFEAFVLSIFRRSIEDGPCDYESTSKIIRNVSSAKSSVLNEECGTTKYRVDMVLDIDFAFYENNWVNSSSLVVNDLLEFSQSIGQMIPEPIFTKLHNKEICDIGLESFLRKNPTSGWGVYLNPHTIRTGQCPSVDGTTRPHDNPTLDFTDIDIHVSHETDTNEELHLVNVCLDIRGINVMSRIFPIIAIRQTQLIGHLAQRIRREASF